MQYKWVALSVTTVGALMAGVDARIVLVGLPSIAKQLGANVDQIIWVSQAYLLASTIGLLFIGRTADVVGRVRIYNYGFLVFTIGSALATFSFTGLELIAARIVQGIGASMILSNSAAIITDAVPRNELGKFLGINSIAYRIGSMAGLTLSGVILAITSWRALFYINIPIGIFGTVWAYKRLKDISGKIEKREMDWIGFVLFTAGLSLVLLSITLLSYGLSGYLWGFTLLAVGSGLLIQFVLLELKDRKIAPLLDPSLFKIKQFAGGSIAQLINAIASSGIVIMASFYLQVVMGYTPLETGLQFLALDLTVLVVAPLSGRLSDRFGSRKFAIIGLAICSVGFFMFVFINSIKTIPILLIALVTFGLGEGLWIPPNISSVMGSVPANRRGIASAFRITLSNIGDTLSFGFAILLMTLAIPFKTLSLLVLGNTTQVQTFAAKQEFIIGFQIVAVVLAIINGLAIFPASFAKRKAISEIVT